MRLLSTTQGPATYRLAQAADGAQRAEEAARVCAPQLPAAPPGTAPPEPNLICSLVYRWTGQEWLALTAGTIVKIAFVLILAWFLTRLIRRGIRRFVNRLTREGAEKAGLLRMMSPLADTSTINLQRATARAQTIGDVIRSFAVVAIWVTAGITVLGAFNINLGPLIAGAGIAGIALGFGAQNLVRDFLSGIFMLLEDQYGVGDVIDVGEATGLVEGVSLRTTRLRDVSGTVWYVPNGEIRRVGNMSHHWSRALLDVPIAYDTDLDRAGEIIKQVADEMAADAEWSSLILSDPEVWGLEQWGDSQMTVRLVVQTVPLEQWKVARELRRRLKMAFDREGIEIPFPQRTIWVRHEDGQEDPAGGPAVPAAGQETPGPAI